jgi:hypothetical protein
MNFELTERLVVQAAEGFRAVDLNWCHPNGAAALDICMPVNLGSFYASLKSCIFFIVAGTNDRLSQQI